MNLIRSFVRRPATTVMLVLVFVVLGVVSYCRMPVDMFPELDFPLVQIVCVYPGAGPEELESQMVKKIEDEISNISDIKYIQSEINEGYAYTIVRFKLGVDVDIKALDVKDKIEQIKRELPEDAEDPLVSKYDPLSTPVVKVALVSDRLSPRDLYELADKNIKNDFAQVTGVAKVELLGGAKRQINVWLQPAKLEQYGLTPADVVRALGQESIDVPAGNIYGKDREIGVRFKGEAKSTAAVSELLLNAPGHGVIRIGDVARVEDGSEQLSSLVKYKSGQMTAGREAVVLDIYKRADGNPIEVADGVYAKIAEIEKVLPAGVELHLADDKSGFIRDAVKNAVSNIWMGVVLCSLTLWIFLRDVRITLVAAVVIPTSIVSAFLLMDAFGFTLNVMSLSALGVSIGALVANAIVVLENIARHVEEGQTPREGATIGTAEIAVAVMAAAGTNIVVFTPIAFMGGIVGKFFYQFGLTVVFATIFSIIASFTLTPMLAGLVVKAQSEKRPPRFFLTRILHAPLQVVEALVTGLQKSYDGSLPWVLRHPIVTNLATLVLLVASVFLMAFIGGEFFPAGDEGQITIQAQLPKGATFEAADRVLGEIERVVNERVPELLDYTAQAGGETKGFDDAHLALRLVDVKDRERTQDEVMYSLQDGLARVPGAEILAMGARRGPGGSDLDIEVYDPDYRTQAGRAQEMREAIMGTGNFRAVFNSNRAPKDEVYFIPYNFRRADYATPNALMGIMLRYGVEGQKGAVLRIGGEEYEIKARMDESARNSVEDLKTYLAPGAKGLTPLSQLGEFKRVKGISKLDRMDKRRVIYLRSYISRLSLTENMKLLQETFADLGLVEGRDFKFAGIADEQRETAGNILIALALAIVLTYMLLAAILDSFIHPLTILATVPLGLVGVLLALFFTGTTLNMMSMMAVVMLVGIVVNNAILIIDYALQQMKTCPEDLADCTRKACVVKFRAVLMTNLAIVAGIFPQAMGGSGAQFMRPIAVATIGGVAVSTLFTFFTIPALFIIVQKMVDRVRAWLKLQPAR